MLDFEVLRDLRVGINVDVEELQLALSALHIIEELWLELLAGPAPGCATLNQDRARFVLKSSLPVIYTGHFFYVRVLSRRFVLRRLS